MGCGRHPGRRCLSPAEPGDQGRVETVGLVAGQLARTVGLDAGRVHDADPYARSMQRIGEIQPPVPRGLQAGVQGQARLGAILGKPRQELLEARFAIGEGGLTHALADQERRIELALRDVDADDVHGASPIGSQGPPLGHPCNQALRPSRRPRYRSAREAIAAAGPNLRDEHEARGKDRLTAAVSAIGQ
jgi:hypothetical protein